MRDLIEGYPLAWVLAPAAPIASAALLPLLGDYDEEGRLVRLVGHMSRRNPLAALFAQGGAKGQFLFTGPQGYVSPEHSGRRNWGPTWNYAAARIEADVRMDETLTEPVIARLIDAHEAGRAEPWRAAELEGRYAGMVAAVIGFEARVLSVDASFKLAQDEDMEVLGHLMEAYPDAAMREWMLRMNKDRLA